MPTPSRLTVINDFSARLSALMSGQVDPIHRVDPKTVALVMKNPKVQMVRAPGGWLSIMPMMIDRDPYSNADLRTALKYAIDREAVLKTMFSGFGTVGNDSPIPRGRPVLQQRSCRRPPTTRTRRRSTSRRPAPRAAYFLQASDAAFGGAVDMAQLFQTTPRRRASPSR